MKMIDERDIWTYVPVDTNRVIYNLEGLHEEGNATSQNERRGASQRSSTIRT